MLPRGTHPARRCAGTPQSAESIPAGKEKRGKAGSPVAKDPESYNREIIWPDKVEINKAYIKEWSLKKDIAYLIKTVLG